MMAAFRCAVYVQLSSYIIKCIQLTSILQTGHVAYPNKRQGRHGAPSEWVIRAQRVGVNGSEIISGGRGGERRGGEGGGVRGGGKEEKIRKGEAEGNSEFRLLMDSMKPLSGCRC